MRDLASRTNGRYVRLTTFGDLLDGLRQALVVKDEYVEWPLLGLRVIPLPGGSAVTMTHVLFGLFLGLVTAEWLIRRRYLLQ